LKQKKIPVSKAHIDAMNDEILILHQDMNPTTSDISELSDYLASLHTHAANVSWLLKLEKAKIDIQASQEYSIKIKAERKVKAEASVEKAKDEAAKLEKQLQRKAEKENPALLNYRKTIESLRGLYGAKAEEMAEAMGIRKPE
jgi:septum formation inhibitor MinC